MKLILHWIKLNKYRLLLFLVSVTMLTLATGLIVLAVECILFEQNLIGFICLVSSVVLLVIPGFIYLKIIERNESN